MMRTYVIVGFLFVMSSVIQPAFGATDADAACRPYFGSACSEAIGRWLPNIPNARGSLAKSSTNSTTVVDEIIDPGGRGELRFLRQRGVYRGTFFVYGTAGPPSGHAVYDPVHRIALFDEGCCSWHHVVVASRVPSPPKNIVARSLTSLRTKRGIRLGDAPSTIVAIYGRARTHAVGGAADEKTLSYSRVEEHPPGATCEASMTFLFARDRLTAMDFTDAC